MSAGIKPLARTKSFSNVEVEALLKTMRDGGVMSFKYKGLEVQFAPNFPKGTTVEGELDDDPFVVAQRVKNAVEQFNKVNNEDQLNLDWST